ncbi:membrane integrity-associated transporter subunit PqiC [Methyloversatilis discipulorum]|uniref:PqiC family protein n=1 Tax=Methyloversatilis discipulorum TaxID=1119528 RepID=UPI00036E07D4|nr:PqiC family protein [Methyloversatilis discipulorum]
MSRLRLIPVAIVALLLGGCGSSPTVRHYTLTTGQAPVAAGAPSPTVVVGPVSLPEAVDRLQIVQRVAGSRAEPAQGHRWAGSLKAELARRIAASIARERGLARVVAAPQNSVTRPDLAVPIDVLRLDADGFSSVTLEAVWAVRRDGADIGSGRFSRSEPVSAPTYEALVEAHGRLADALAAEIAAAIR